MEPTLTTTRGQTISYTHFLTRSPIIKMDLLPTCQLETKGDIYNTQGTNNYTLKDRGGFKNSF